MSKQTQMEKTYREMIRKRQGILEEEEEIEEETSLNEALRNKEIETTVGKLGVKGYLDHQPD